MKSLLALSRRALAKFSLTASHAFRPVLAAEEEVIQLFIDKERPSQVMLLIIPVTC